MSIPIESKSYEKILEATKKYLKFLQTFTSFAHIKYFKFVNNLIDEFDIFFKFINIKLNDNSTNDICLMDHNLIKNGYKIFYHCSILKKILTHNQKQYMYDVYLCNIIPFYNIVRNVLILFIIIIDTEITQMFWNKNGLINSDYVTAVIDMIKFEVNGEKNWKNMFDDECSLIQKYCNVHTFKELICINLDCKILNYFVNVPNHWLDIKIKNIVESRQNFLIRDDDDKLIMSQKYATNDLKTFLDVNGIKIFGNLSELINDMACVIKTLKHMDIIEEYINTTISMITKILLLIIDEKTFIESNANIMYLWCKKYNEVINKLIATMSKVAGSNSIIDSFVSGGMLIESVLNFAKDKRKQSIDDTKEHMTRISNNIIKSFFEIFMKNNNESYGGVINLVKDNGHVYPISSISVDILKLCNETLEQHIFTPEFIIDIAHGITNVFNTSIYLICNIIEISAHNVCSAKFVSPENINLGRCNLQLYSTEIFENVALLSSANIDSFTLLCALINDIGNLVVSLKDYLHTYIVGIIDDQLLDKCGRRALSMDDTTDGIEKQKIYKLAKETTMDEMSIETEILLTQGIGYLSSIIIKLLNFTAIEEILSDTNEHLEFTLQLLKPIHHNKFLRLLATYITRHTIITNIKSNTYSFDFIEKLSVFATKYNIKEKHINSCFAVSLLMNKLIVLGKGDSPEHLAIIDKIYDNYPEINGTIISKVNSKHKPRMTKSNNVTYEIYQPIRSILVDVENNINIFHSPNEWLFVEQLAK